MMKSYERHRTAGGTGSRLFPLTKITNKHLLPIYDKPMIYYPDPDAGGCGHPGYSDGHRRPEFGGFSAPAGQRKGIRPQAINYTYQEGEGGIADALALAEHFADGHKICVILGDNIIEGSIREAADEFRKQRDGAHILLKEVPDAERFGVAEMDGDRIVGIEEKPKRPKSNYAVTGIYMYDATVFDKIKTLVPSRPRRAGNHRRQQRLHQRRHHDVLVPGRMVDGRRHVRFAAARHQPGGAVRQQSRPRRAVEA